MNIELKRPKEAAKILGIGLSTFWLWAKKDPEFPPLIKLSARCTAVRVSDLQAFVDRKSGGMAANGGPGGGMTVNIKAMDSKDVIRALRTNSALPRATHGGPDRA